MTQWIKATATKPGDLSSSSRFYTVEETINPANSPLTSTLCCGMYPL